jgi:hypothetical protein
MQVKERVRKEEEAAASAENVEQLKKTLQEVEIKGTSQIFIYIEISSVDSQSGPRSRRAKKTHKKSINFFFLTLDVLL